MRDRVGVHWGDVLRLGLCSFMGSRASAYTSRDLSLPISTMGGLEGELPTEAFQCDLL